MKLNLTPHSADERVTHTLEARQLWRQVGWIGQTGTIYAIGDEDGVRSERGSFRPLWILLEDERVRVDEESR